MLMSLHYSNLSCRAKGHSVSSISVIVQFQGGKMEFQRRDLAVARHSLGFFKLTTLGLGTLQMGLSKPGLQQVSDRRLGLIGS
jgi:hypothetical protein